MISLGSQRCGGIALTTGALPWLHTGSSVRTDLDSKDRNYLLFIHGRAAGTHRAMPREEQSQLRAYGSELEAEQHG